MKRACLLSLAVFAAIYAAYALFLWPRVEAPGPPLLALFGALGTAMLAGSLSEIWSSRRDRAALDREARLVPLRDGELEAASGPVLPLGAPLSAPFSGRECVAYEYEVSRSTAAGGDAPGGMEASGVALTPCVVRSPRGDVALLGWSLLDAFQKGKGKSAEDRSRAAAYFDGLAPSQVEKLGPADVLSVLKDLLADDDGTVRKDWRTGKGPLPLEGATLSERVVAAGETVTALGIYSASRGGFVPPREGSLTLNRLLPGSGEAFRVQLALDSRKKLAVGLVFCIAFNGFVGAVTYLAVTRWKRAAPSEHHAALLGAGGDTAKLERLLERGVDPNARSESGEPYAADVRDAAVVRLLLKHGLDPNVRDRDGWPLLVKAAGWAKLDLVDALLDAGASPDLAGGGAKRTALIAAREAGREEIAERLLAAGAKDDRVTAANGVPVPADGGPPFAAVKRYLSGIADGDLARARAATTWGDGVAWAGIDLDLWRRVRPVVLPSVVDGFQGDGAADLLVEGRGVDGASSTWGYHLVEENGAWRILREWEVAR